MFPDLTRRLRKAARTPLPVLAARLTRPPINLGRALWAEKVGFKIIPVPKAQMDEALGRLDLVFPWRGSIQLREWLLRDRPFRQWLAERAEQALEHRTDLLGAQGADLGSPVDWHRDYQTGKVWPKTHFSRINFAALDDPCDVKRCWDLSRAYHWVWLAQSHWLEDRAAAAREICEQWRGWLEANPPEIGVNWGNAMEVGLRVVSWCWVLALLKGSPALSPELLGLILGDVAAQARYMEKHLEFGSQGLNSNHLLGDYLGLTLAGIVLAAHPSASRWRQIGLEGLWRELERQVYADGVDYEQASEYHRFISEMFLFGAIIARRAGMPPPPEAMQRIESMLDYSLHLTRPDGLTDSLGDGDDGRVFWLNQRMPRDHRGLLALGAVIFQRGDFKWVAGEAPPAEVAWVLGPQGLRDYRQLAAAEPGDTCKAFPQGGTYVSRTGWDAGATMVVADAGYLGMGPTGTGSHGHADTLSFTFFAQGRPWLVDPGTYVYTSDPAWRNAFRGTRMHNGLTIDGQDICSFSPGLFSWAGVCHPKVRQWSNGENWILLEAEHDGYARLEDGLVHRRLLALYKKLPLLVVWDRVQGKGPRLVERWFQLGPGVRLQTRPAPWGTWCGPREEESRAPALWAWRHPAEQTAIYHGDQEARLGWHSDGYGRKEPACTIRLTGERQRLPWEGLVVVTASGLAPHELRHLSGLEELPSGVRLAWSFGQSDAGQ